MPAHNAEYLQRRYWDARFEHESQHEWLGGYTPELRAILRQHVPCGARVLILGNGTSQLPLELARDGFTRITATDISTLAVQTLQSQARQQGLAQITWQQADMMALPFADASFDAVVEKATLDALVVDAESPWETPPAVQQRVDTALAEVHRWATLPGCLHRARPSMHTHAQAVRRPWLACAACVLLQAIPSQPVLGVQRLCSCWQADCSPSCSWKIQPDT